MRRKVRFTSEAAEDLLRLYDFLVERDLDLAESALDAIREGLALVSYSPFACRMAKGADPFLRELVIPFGTTGYVALFRVERRQWLTVLAVRHQREDDLRR